MPGSRPSPRRTPGRVGARATRRPNRTGRPRAAAPPQQAARRARFTGRAAVLVLVLAVLMVSYASSMKAYLQQRKQITGLEHDIASAKVDIASLQREKARWADPAYLKTMAHARLGFVMPGEISYQVVGADGKPLGHHDSLGDQNRSAPAQPQWWQAAWASDVAAGDPPQPHRQPTPATKISAPKHQ